MVDVTCEAFSELDKEVQQEFYDDVVTAIADVNACVSLLEDSVDDGVMERMFRAIHTVKGNCNMVFLTDFVNSVHRLEDLFSSIRAKEITYHSVYGRFAIQIVNLIQSQLKELIETNKADGDVLQNIKVLIDQVINSEQSERESTAQKAIISVEDGHFSIGLVVLSSDNSQGFSFLDATDMEFFEFISSIHQQKTINQKFGNIFLTLATKLNDKLSASSEKQQLMASVIFLQLTQSIDEDGTPLPLDTQQCIIASGLLSRMAGWGDAAQLCIQANEKHDASGEPVGLEGNDIHPAAQVLGLAYDFAHRVVSSSNQEYKTALFGAVKAINSLKDTRYKERLIERFNHLIKSEYLTNQMF